MGAAMLSGGAGFGFNAGSELLSDDLTSSAFAVTQFFSCGRGGRMGFDRVVAERQADGAGGEQRRWFQVWFALLRRQALCSPCPRS